MSYTTTTSGTESGKPAYSTGQQAKSVNVNKSYSNPFHDKEMREFLKMLGMNEEEEEDEELPWLLRGLRPSNKARVPEPANPNRKMMYLGGDSGNYLGSQGMRDPTIASYAPPLSSMSRSGDYAQATKGHSMDITMQYSAGDGGTYRMNIKTGAESTPQALAYAMTAFYALASSQQKGEDYNCRGGKSYNSGRGYGRGGKSYRGSGYGGRGGYSGGKGGYSGGKGGN